MAGPPDAGSRVVRLGCHRQIAGSSSSRGHVSAVQTMSSGIRLTPMLVIKQFCPTNNASLWPLVHTWERTQRLMKNEETLNASQQHTMAMTQSLEITVQKM